MRRSLWLDVKPQARQATNIGEVTSGEPSWVEGRVTEVLDGGWVEVEVPYDQPESRATGPTDGFVTQVGARVRVLLDAKGRILQITSPVEIDSSQPVTPTGPSGEIVQKAMADAQEAFTEAEGVRGRAEEAFQRAEAAQGLNIFPDPYFQAADDWAGSFGQWGVRQATLVPAASAGVGTVGNACRFNWGPGAGSVDTVTYQRELALDKTAWYTASFALMHSFTDTAHRAGAYVAFEVKTWNADALESTTEVFRVNLADVEPGALHRGSTQFQVPVTSLDGRTQVAIKAFSQVTSTAGTVTVGEVRLERTVGATLIEPNSITTSRLYVDEELWARLGVFAKVTTDMLTAGDATVTGEMVVGDLHGNNIVGGSLALSDLSAAAAAVAEPVNWRTEANHAVNQWAAGSTFTKYAKTSDEQTGANFRWEPRGTGGWVNVTGRIQFNVLLKFPGTTMTQAANGPRKITLDIASDYPLTRVYFSIRPDGSDSFTLSSPSVSNVPASTPTTLTLDVPDGVAWNLNQDTPNLRVYVDAGTRTSGTFRVGNLNIATTPTVASGVRVYRDASGLARIDVTGSDGMITTMSSQGVSLTSQAGVALGSTSWRNLIAPPRAITISSGYNHAVAHGNWVNGVLGTTRRVVRGGVSFNTTLNTITVPSTGYYRLLGRVKFAANSSGRRIIGFRVNGGAADTNNSVVPTAGTHTVECNAMMYLTAGDYVALGMFQDSGVSLNTTYRELSIVFDTE